VNLGNYVKLGNYVNSLNLSEQIIQSLRGMCGQKIKLTKWVTRDRRSPGWGDAAGREITYAKGAIIEEPDAVTSDQQCAAGLHVFLLGHRPEWYGLNLEGLELIPLTVEVDVDDICFAGLPTMFGKLRVRKLEVLD
jgi:hypothetical protein